MLSIDRAGKIDIFENLDIVHIRLLVAPRTPGGPRTPLPPWARGQGGPVLKTHLSSTFRVSFLPVRTVLPLSSAGEHADGCPPGAISKGPLLRVRRGPATRRQPAERRFNTLTTLEAAQGQILSQSPTDATSGR